MASIHSRENKTGEIIYSVLWRDSESGQQASMPCANEREALLWKRLIEESGNNLNMAAKALEKGAIKAPTVAEMITQHIAHLASARPDTTKRHERAVKNDFSGTLGKLPATAVDGFVDEGPQGRRRRGFWGFLWLHAGEERGAHVLCLLAV